MTLAILDSLSGGLFALRRVDPTPRARTWVEWFMNALLMACSTIAVLMAEARNVKHAAKLGHRPRGEG